MIQEFLVLILGIASLLKGASLLIKSSSKIARYFGVSDFIIGLTLVAIGTSIPELAVAISSALSKNYGITLGNVVGANIANISLILGVSALFAVLVFDSDMFKRDCLFLLGITILFVVFSLNGLISRVEGLFLFSLFLFYIGYLIRFRPGEGYYNYESYLKSYFSFYKKFFSPITYVRMFENGIRTTKKQFNKKKSVAYHEKIFVNLIKEFLLSALGIILIYYGAKFVVPAASRIALSLNFPQSVIGALLIATGTTLPELAVSIVSLQKKLNNILIGNLIGSNIGNILLVGGIGSLISPLVVDKISLFFLMPVMILVVLLLLAFISSHWALRLLEGFILITTYILFVIFLVLIAVS